MGPMIIRFDERAFVDCIEKVDGNFVVGFGSWLRCYSELIPLVLDSMLYPEIKNHTMLQSCCAVTITYYNMIESIEYVFQPYIGQGLANL
jgi:hypothetical protein